MSNEGNQQARPAPPSAIAARLSMSYIASQALNAATKLGVADLLGKGPLTFDEIAQATQTQPGMMRRLLRALAAFEVVKDLGSGEIRADACR